MKATGIVRRIDDLGRVVIPKEIRRTMRFNEGTEIQIFTDNDQVIFQRYSAIESMGAIVKDMLEVLYRTHKAPVIACDKDKVIVAKGIGKEEIVNRRITADLDEIIERRGIYAHDTDRCLRRIDHVGRVQPSAHPDLQHNNVTLVLIKVQQGHGGNNFKFRRRVLHPVCTFAQLIYQIPQFPVGNRNGVYLYPLTEFMDERGCIQSGFISGFLQDARKHGGCRALPVRTGYMDKLQLLLRVSQ